MPMISSEGTSKVVSAKLGLNSQEEIWSLFWVVLSSLVDRYEVLDGL